MVVQQAAPVATAPAYGQEILRGFVPVELERLAADLSGRPELSEEQRSALREFSERFVAWYSVQLQRRLRELKRAYSPFHPDRDTLSFAPAVSGPSGNPLAPLQRQIDAILERANYSELTRDHLNRALARTSPRGVRVSVDFDDFEAIAVWYRGTATRLDERRDWRRLWLDKIRFETPVYRRLFLLLKVRGEERGFTAAEAQPLLLKLFKDVAHSDLEMLFPNTRVRMSAFDKLKLGITGGGGTIGGLAATLTKIGAAANPATWALAIAGFGAIIWRQVANVFATRTRYMVALAENLYFHNLDNNLGVLTHLVEMAEEEECKEAVLSYAFLVERGAEGLAPGALDDAVQDFVRERYGVNVDFQVEDGLRKLREANLLAERGDGAVAVVEPAEALRRLGDLWAGLLPDQGGQTPGASAAPTLRAGPR